ncbi:hypothetical protein NMG60_11024844 [Bertholletia excelsa]
MVAMDTVRLRVVLEDRHMLSKHLKSEGLRRSWILLKPHLETISDLSSYIDQSFELYSTCPNGIILSMDGFVLPPFESTCILKDKDVISVKRRGKLSEIVKVGDEANLIEEKRIVVKKSVSVPLLENGGLEEEGSGYPSKPEEGEDRQSEEALLIDNSSGEENAVSKKRKSSRKLQSSKKKRKRSMVAWDTENDVHEEQNENLHHGTRTGKKEKISDANSKAKRAKENGSIEINDIIEPSSGFKRFSKVQENGEECVNVIQTPDASRKVPSRSARRKKAKRQWLRELAKAEKEKSPDSNLQLHQMQSPEEDIPMKSMQHENQIKNHQEANHISDADGDAAADHEIVPIVIRPGHIRFEPLTKDQAAPQNQASMHVATFQWNGITNKKKGQKWGKEKLPSYRRNDDNNSKDCSDGMIIEEVTVPNDCLNFDQLAPFAGLPKEGDIIAYRLVELSSTWTPELSSFRVGKTSWYNSESNKVLLQPVPEYPVSIEKKSGEDELAQGPENSLYREDGSLEIDFSTLVDVRIVKYGESEPSKAVTKRFDEAAVSTVTQNNNDKQTPVDMSTSEKEVNAWDEISQALNTKKAELLQENSWSKENSGPRSGSYRALRGSAIGPTMALLRARNDI